jgi:hypothetical protein
VLARAKQPQAACCCCTIAAAAAARIKPGEMEVGLGIHGEPGYLKQAWQPARELVPAMLQRVLGYGGQQLVSGPQCTVALMVRSHALCGMLAGALRPCLHGALLQGCLLRLAVRLCWPAQAAAAPAAPAAAGEQPWQRHRAGDGSGGQGGAQLPGGQVPGERRRRAACL